MRFIKRLAKLAGSQEAGLLRPRDDRRSAEYDICAFHGLSGFLRQMARVAGACRDHDIFPLRLRQRADSCDLRKSLQNFFKGQKVAVF